MYTHMNSLPPALDDHAKHFFRSLLQKKVNRPTAEECLELPFFIKYIIPPALSDEIFTQTKASRQLARNELPSPWPSGMHCYHWIIAFN